MPRETKPPAKDASPDARWVYAAMHHAKMSGPQLATAMLAKRVINSADRSIPNKIVRGERELAHEEARAISEITGFPLATDHRPPRDVHYAPNPEDEVTPDFDPGDGRMSAGLVDGQVVFHGALPGGVAELRSQGGAGPGQVADTGTAVVRSNGIASGHEVAAEWVIPPSFLRHGLGGSPSSTIIVPVIGHSMEPRLFEGDRVIVDLGQNSWTSEAIYLITDDDVTFQIKTLNRVRVRPPRYAVISEARPDRNEERDEDQLRIVGRVVGRISRP